MTNFVRVEIIALMPTQKGCAVFLGDGKKVIFFEIDPAVGVSINLAMLKQRPSRPLTHDLYLLTLMGFGAKVSHVVIHQQEGEIFYARLILEAENEIMEKKIVELDARPSDCLAIAARSDAPIFVTRELWDRQEDRSNLLEQMKISPPHEPPEIDGYFSE